MKQIKFGMFCGLVAMTASGSAKAQHYYDNAFHFRIQLPPGWKKIRGVQVSEVVSFVSPANPKTKHADASLNVVVAKGKISPLETLASFESDFLGSIQKKYQNFSLLEQGDEKLGPLGSKWMVYGVGAGAEQFDSITFLLLDRAKVPSAYALTFSALPSRFTKLKKKFEKMAISFRAH